MTLPTCFPRASRRFRAALLALALLAAGAPDGARAAGDPDSASANALFGAVRQPTAEGPAEVVGSYARGCLRRAAQLPADGPGWQVMRPSRNRAWGHPRLIDFVGRLAASARRDGLPGLLIGDLSQPRGGPMWTGHASHQVGLDVDVWLTPMPNRRLSRSERDGLAAVSVVQERGVDVEPDLFSQGLARLIRRASLFPEVERIFVHPGIKKALCATAGEDRAWLAKVRPWYGHDDHMHVRLRCPVGDTACDGQDPVPAGDGCGAELKSWLKRGLYRPPTLSRPARPLSLASLPAACTGVLWAE